MDEEGSGWACTYADVINLLAGLLAEPVALRTARFADNATAPSLFRTAAALSRRCSAPPYPGSQPRVCLPFYTLIAVAGWDGPSSMGSVTQ